MAKRAHASSAWGFLPKQEQAKGTLDGELATVLSSIATACKQIASLVTRAGISNLTGMAGAANIQVRAMLGKSIMTCLL